MSAQSKRFYSTRIIEPTFRLEAFSPFTAKQETITSLTLHRGPGMHSRYLRMLIFSTSLIPKKLISGFQAITRPRTRKLSNGRMVSGRNSTVFLLLKAMDLGQGLLFPVMDYMEATAAGAVQVFSAMGYNIGNKRLAASSQPFGWATFRASRKFFFTMDWCSA